MQLDALTINELTPGGEGVGIIELKGERRAVFVPSVIAGEVVKVAVEDPKRRPIRGRLLEVVTASPARVASPPCRFLDRCGACDWMHIDGSERVAEHRRMLARLLKIDESLIVAHAPPSPHGDLGYRTRARVHIESRRSGAIRVGMFTRRSHETAVVDTCVILHPAIERARLAIESWLAGAKGKGEARLALGDPRIAPRRAVLDLSWDGDLPPDVFGRLERAVLAGDLAGARVFAGAVRVPAKIGDPTPFLLGADGEALRLAPGGFAQATEEGNTLLANRTNEAVRKALASTSKGALVELYAGAGNLSVLLAGHAVPLTTVESDHEACVAARENLSARSLLSSATTTTKVIEGDAATFALPKGTSVVVLDPPREGAKTFATALTTSAQAKPKAAPNTIVYVSCDPPTLTRDIELLRPAGYELTAVETFEMFPQTSHVETLAVLTKRTKPIAT